MQKKITSVILAIALICSSLLSFVSITQLEGNARVINYTGIVRGSSQRLVIHELNNMEDDQLIAKIDNIVKELLTGEGENDLIRLDSSEYQELMFQVRENWGSLKEEIYSVREGGSRMELSKASEHFFQLADSAVAAAEQYTEHKVLTARIWLSAVTFAFILMAGLFSYYNSKQSRRQKELWEAENENRKKSEYLARLSDSLRAPLDDISELMYVTDTETYDLLFLNEAGRKTFHADSLSGQKCYRVLQGQEAPCDFCTTPFLKEGETYTWEHTNPFTQRHYLLKDRLILWEGRSARLEIAFDTTEVEKEKQQLKFTLEAEKMITDCVRTLYEEREITEAATQVLERLGRFFAAERTCVFSVTDQKISKNFEWCAQKEEHAQPELQDIPLAAIRRWMPSFDRKECIIIENLEDIRESSPIEYSTLKQRSITSMVVAPLQRDGGLVGYLEVDNPPPGKVMNIAPLLQTLCYFLLLAFQHVENQQQLSHLSYFDVLTSFYNRNRYIEDTNALAKADTQVGVVYLDVNGLKDINDRYGHAFGDDVLKQSAGRMREVFEGADFYRIGGDEFVIICPGMDREKFESLVDQLKVRFREDPLLKAAIGSCWSEKSGSLVQVIGDADAKMYEDKKDFYRRNPASNRYRHHSDELLNLTDPDILQEKLEKERFVVYLQPKISSADRTTVGAEALIRYRSQSDALVLPGNFLPMLEQMESISQLDLFVFEYVCSRLKQWREQGREEFPVSVNFSGSSLSMPSFVERLTTICGSYEIAPENLEIEIKAGKKEVEGLDLKALISDIRGAGFAVSIDGFGTECVNMSILSSVEFDMLKLDKSLFGDIVHNPRTRTVVESIVEICRKLGIRVVAEGIETEEQLIATRSCGVELAQGFLFSKPVSIDEYETKFIH